MKIEKGNIYLGDCLEIMPYIPNKSVDAIICDLPYGVLNRNNPNAKWDVAVPFEPLWAQYERIIKDKGAIILFAQGMFTAQLLMSNPKLWRYNLVWDKVRTSGFLNAKKMPMRVHEDICVFYKELPTYNPQMIKCATHQRNHSRGNGSHKETNNCYGNFGKAEDIITDEKYPRSIIKIAKGHSKGEWQHPTQKPVALLEYLIKTYTNLGGVILDNTMGSGTTCIAAIRTGRHYIGIEKEQQYFDIAKQRISKELAEPKLFDF